MKTIVVTSTIKLWSEAQKTSTYTYSTVDASLDEVGFIHATSPDQTIALLNRRFTDRDDMLLLLADLDKVRPEVKFEPSIGATAGLFPHIYGPLNIDAIYDQIVPTKDASGTYIDLATLDALSAETGA